jgi:N-acetylmuramoyl-L-alanine amidase
MRIIKKLILTTLLLTIFTTTKVKAEEINVYINRWGIQLNMDEIELVSRIVQLECGHDIRESKYATIETIFNRVFDPRYPNTVEEVLSQKGQFSTWKNRNIAKATPTDDTYECVAMVLNGQTNVLEYDRLKFNNKPIGQNPIKIGAQYYGSQK